MSEPIKEEVPPTTKPVEKEVPTGPVDKRIFIGGLHPTVSEKEIQDRFSKFGKVNAVHVAKNTADECRGFAHMTIHTTPKQWESCLSVYNGAKWRGQELKLEEAKPDYQVRFQQRQEKIKEQEEKKRKRLLRWNDSEGFHAKDMTPVTDNNMGTRKGWKRGRYGRAIAVMRLKKNDGTKFVFEPTHYKNNLEKLYNIGVRMKPVNQLITKVEEDDDDEDEEARWPKLRRLSNDHQQQEEEEGEEREDYKMTDDEKRRFAMEKMFADQHAKKQMMQKALVAAQGDKQHTSFEQEEEEKVDDVFQMDLDKEEEHKEPVEAKKWMFDSDEEEEEEEEFNIEINPVLEGEAGRKRLELQKKFKGDDRFKLGEDFIDPAEKEAQKKEVGDAISQELGADKSQAMDVLNAMFGERRVDPKVQPRNTAWTNPARFDPDAEDSSQYLADKPQREEEEEEEEEEEFTPRVESAKPIVSTAKHFEVSTNLKPLFGDAEEAPFTLFGGNNNSTPVTTKPLFAPTLNSKSGKDFTSNFIPQKPEGQIGLGVMFFFHLDDPSLMKKSCYSYDAAGIFQQKSDEKDSYESKWRTQRPIIKEILKKRQKNAVKNQKKRSTTRDSK